MGYGALVRHREETARNACKNPDKTQHFLDLHRDLFLDYYAERGVDWLKPSPRQRRMMKLLDRHLLSASIAPLVRGVGAEIAAVVQERLAGSDHLVSASYKGCTPPMSGVVIKSYGEGDFSDSNRAFLHGACLLSYEATARFLNQTETGEWARPIVVSYGKAYGDEILRNQNPSRYEPPLSSINRALALGRVQLINHMLGANLTAMNTLIGAQGHARLWGAENNSPEALRDAVTGRVSQLGWLATVSGSLNDRLFPLQTSTPEPLQECPFAHDPSMMKQSVWSIESLHDGPWKIPMKCPAAIAELVVPNQQGRLWTKTAVEQQLLMAVNVAAETMFTGHPENTPVPGIFGHEVLY